MYLSDRKLLESLDIRNIQDLLVAIGDHLGNAGYTKISMDVHSICKELLSVRQSQMVPLNANEQELAKTGIMDAINAYRQRTGATLPDAKAVIDFFRQSAR